MGGENDLPGAARKAARTQRAGTKRKSRAAACGTPGRAQRGEPANPATDGRPIENAAAHCAAPLFSSAMTTDLPRRRTKRRIALSARPPAVRRARAAVLSRRTAKTGAPSAQRGQNKHTIPVGACRRQRAPINCRAPSSGGVAGASSPSGWGTARRGWPSGEGFPLAFHI